jgi:hypothetical protein
MRDVFLSYSSNDRKRAVGVVDALERSGLTVWWDRDLLAGESYDEKIQAELEASRCVVVLWSETSIQSNWVKVESQEAAKKKRLVPVLLDAVRQPLEFRLINAIELVGWDSSSETPEFQRLLLSIAKIAATANAPREQLQSKAPEPRRFVRLPPPRTGWIQKARGLWARPAERLRAVTAGGPPEVPAAPPALPVLARYLIWTFAVPFSILLCSYLVLYLAG